MTNSQHIYEVRPRKDRRGFDLISDALPFGRLWYAETNAISNAIGYAKFFSRSHPAIIRVYDESGALSRRTNQPAIFMLDRSLATRLRSRSGLPRVRIVHNWLSGHRSAGEEARALFFSFCRLRRVYERQNYSCSGSCCLRRKALTAAR